MGSDCTADPAQFDLRLPRVKSEPEADALHGMRRMAHYLRAPNLGCLVGYNDGTCGILMITPIAANAMAAVGWTKTSMREFLWVHSKIPGEQLRPVCRVAEC